ncbi:MAG: 23S rRNA (guanosine(2251)-2'-O)-methyltransferase RlmB [Anaerolineaceae bacterium]|nr:23S rRNA (guanosine(2251)-2'-O)-methyltransferase RlmB [Anaerolineaceae bacterium]
MKEWITGRNPVYECLRAGRRHFFRLWINKKARIKGRIEDIYRLANNMKLSIQAVDNHILTAITERHQGVALEVSSYPYCDLYKILENASRSVRPLFFLLIDQIQDVQNLGTLMRSAEIFGIHGVVMPANRNAGITPAVVNASSGASEHLLIAQMNISQAIDELKAKGAWVVGLDMDKSAELLKSVNLAVPLAIVVGSEGKGMRRLVREKCDHIAYIPMIGKVASLNVAVAGSIALYEASAQRAKLSLT